jgi:hypothetical protein
MKTKRIIIFGVLAVLVIAYIISIIPSFRHRSEWSHTVRALRALPRERVDSAVEAFVRAQKAQGRAVSDAVSLRELVAGGFLRADEAAPFGGMDVAFALRVDETRPQQIVARVPLRSGAVAVQLADGSIQQVTRAALDRQDHK